MKKTSVNFKYIIPQPIPPKDQTATQAWKIYKIGIVWLKYQEHPKEQCDHHQSWGGSGWAPVSSWVSKVPNSGVML